LNRERNFHYCANPALEVAVLILVLRPPGAPPRPGDFISRADARFVAIPPSPINIRDQGDAMRHREEELLVPNIHDQPAAPVPAHMVTLASVARALNRATPTLVRWSERGAFPPYTIIEVAATCSRRTTTLG
jgi:hypothetical protein